MKTGPMPTLTLPTQYSMILASGGQTASAASILHSTYAPDLHCPPAWAKAMENGMRRHSQPLQETGIHNTHSRSQTSCTSSVPNEYTCVYIYITMLYYTILYYTILYYTILYYTILYYTILYYTILIHTILYYTILYYTILYYTILYYTILYYTILYYTNPYYTILYYTILYYTILDYTRLD